MLTAVTAVLLSVLIFAIYEYATMETRTPPKGPAVTFRKLIEKTSPAYRRQLIHDLEMSSKDIQDFDLKYFFNKEAITEFLEREVKVPVHIAFEHIKERGRFRHHNLEVMPMTHNSNEFLFLRYHFKKKIPPFILVPLTILLVGLFTALVSTIFNYREFGKFYSNARQVIDKIKTGDFAARFDVDREDEVGQSMFAFNEMAEEVEKYVMTIKRAENNRIKILQELAHDLRTPIASLKNTVDTLIRKREKMTKEQESDFFGLAESEIQYFEKLVEDLLFLAKMSEPKYELKKEEIHLEDFVGFEVDRLNKMCVDKNINLHIDLAVEKINVDAHLTKRLIRNALENASSFANQTIDVEVKEIDNNISITITDDGPGFSEAALADFGIRKASRRIIKDHNGRVSVGLGSVIMQTIVELHRGKISAKNIMQDTEIKGSIVKISLPL